MKKKTFASLALLLCAVFLLSGCKADFVGNKIKIKDRYLLEFSVLNTTEKETLSLQSGDNLSVKIELEEGEVAVSVVPVNGGEALYRGSGLQKEEFSLTAKESGKYSIEVTGKEAKGRLVFEKIEPKG